MLYINHAYKYVGSLYRNEKPYDKNNQMRMYYDSIRAYCNKAASLAIVWI